MIEILLLLLWSENRQWIRLLLIGIIVFWYCRLIFAVEHNDVRKQYKLFMLPFKARRSQASPPVVVRVGGGRFLSESRPCPQHCMEILHSSGSQRQITEQSTAMTQSFLCFIVLILISPQLNVLRIIPKIISFPLLHLFITGCKRECGKEIVRDSRGYWRWGWRNSSDPVSWRRWRRKRGRNRYWTKFWARWRKFCKDTIIAYHKSNVKPF